MILMRLGHMQSFSLIETDGNKALEINKRLLDSLEKSASRTDSHSVNKAAVLNGHGGVFSANRASCKNLPNIFKKLWTPKQDRMRTR